MWVDTVDFGANFYYWVRHISTSNIVGQFAGAVNVTTSKITDSNADTVIEAGAISAQEIAAGTITAAKMSTGTITAASGIIADAAIANAKISDLSAAKINTGFLNADRIEGSTLNISSKGVVGSAGNIVAGTGSVSTTTQSTTGNATAPVVFWGAGQPSLLSTYAAGSPFHQYSGATLPEIASKTFTTTSRIQNYNFVGHHGESGSFDGDEEKLIVISVQQTNGTVVSSGQGFQYVNNAMASDIFSIALNVTLSANTTFVAKLYGGLKNVNLHPTAGVVSLSGNIMVFGLGL